MEDGFITLGNFQQTEKSMDRVNYGGAIQAHLFASLSEIE